MQLPAWCAGVRSSLALLQPAKLYNLSLLSSCAGNFVGSLAFVAAVVASGVLAQGAMYPIKTALYKSSLTWGQVGDGGAARHTAAGSVQRMTANSSPRHNRLQTDTN